MDQEIQDSLEREGIDFSKSIQGDNKMEAKLDWMRKFHSNEYIPMLTEQYQKVTTISSERSTVLFKRPNANNKNNELSFDVKKSA